MEQKNPGTGGEITLPLPNQKEHQSLLSKFGLTLIIIYILLKPLSLFAQIDVNEFPPGHPNVTVSAIDQLKAFPVPRYKTGHTMLPNFNWMDPMYFGGRFQPGVTDAQAVTNSVEIQTELAKNYNYMLVLGGSPNFHNAWVDLANQNPQWKVSMITFRAQIGTKLWQGTLPNDHYLQNSGGQFIDPNGNVTGAKYWRPTAPVSSYVSDGLAVKNNLSAALSNLNRDLDFINENGEVFTLYPNSTMAMDPVVTAAKNASGLGWEDFLGLKMKENDVQAYRDQFMTLPKLQNAKFSEYRIDGQRDWNFRYEQTRYINTPINGQYYATSDFYPRWPSNWQDWMGPWHGLKWMTESRHYEMAAGDRLYSPFVAPGWDANPEVDMRPAQWLGLLKLLSIYGAEFFYTGYFNDQGSYNPPNPPPHDPRGYAWQAVIPSYAQAVTSRYEDILRNGSLLAGDMINVSAIPDIPYYQFNTGFSNKVVAVRKHDNANKYIIAGTIQNNSNVINSTPLASDVAITLNGQTLQFNVRRQGSTFMYDNSVPSAPVFYQVDGWHESSHPYNWTKDFNLEAELFDNNNPGAIIKTRVPAGTAAGDFRNAYSYVSFNSASDITYDFEPRGSAATDYYLWVKVRSKDGTSTGLTVTLDGANLQQFDCITDTNFVWYRFNTSNQAVMYNNLSNAPHQLKITPSNTSLEIDKISIITSSSAVYGNTPSPCGTATASITANGPTSFCQGGSVTLTANSGTSYAWSTGETTQFISVNTSGSYVVTVSGTAVSAPVNVTVHPLPAVNVSANGPLTFCQGSSIILSSNTGSSYLWSPSGETTQSITVNAGGSYSVNLTDANGCSASSAPTTVVIHALPVADITASGPLTFNQGDSVVLTSSLASSYLWSPGNETTQSITVTSSGTYSVQVTSADGCTAVSAPVLVTVNGGGTQGTAIITPAGPTTFCDGGNVTLSANAGLGYLWSTGETTQSITANASGSYIVTVTFQANTDVSDPVNIVVNSLPLAEIIPNGPTAFCDGDNVTLSASSGSSWLWIPSGNTSQTITVDSAGIYSVIVTNSNGCSATSLPVTVVVTNCNNCPVPTGLYETGISGSNATLNWTAVTGADSLQIMVVDVFAWGNNYLTPEFSAADNQYTISVEPNKWYLWRIRSKCGSTFTAWSPYGSFLTYSGSRVADSTGTNAGEPEVTESTRLQPAEESMSLNVFPNPATNETTVSFSVPFYGNADIRLLDYTGKEVLNDHLQVSAGMNAYKIDLNNYPKGIYMVVLEFNMTTSSKRMVIQ